MPGTEMQRAWRLLYRIAHSQRGFASERSHCLLAGIHGCQALCHRWPEGKGLLQSWSACSKRALFPSDIGTGMSKASPDLHVHGKASLVLCKRDVSLQEEQEKLLKEKASTGLRVSRWQVCVTLLVCTSCQKPSSAGIHRSPFPRKKIKADSLLSKSCWVLGPWGWQNSLLSPLLCPWSLRAVTKWFVAALLRAVTMVENCCHAVSFSPAQPCLHSLPCVTWGISSSLHCLFPINAHLHLKQCMEVTASQELMGSEMLCTNQSKISQECCCCLTVAALEEANPLKTT